jgi:hypothetical protein
MQLRAYILLYIWGLLLIEPLTASISSIETMYSACSVKQKTKSSDCKSACEKPGQEEEDDCEDKGCNPLMSCPTGNFYFFGYTALSIDAFIAAKQKTVLVNDNRIMKYMAECWHPPEII